MASSTTPRLAPMWPPVTEQHSIIRSRISRASTGSWSRRRPLRSAGEAMPVRRDMGGSYWLSSRTSGHNIVRQRAQRARRDAGAGEVCDGPLRVPLRLGAGALDAQHPHVGRLGERLIATRGLAELSAGTGGIEHVVGNLESETDLLSVPTERLDRRRVGPRRQPAQGARGPDESAGLAPMDVHQLGQVQEPAFGLEVEPLAA